MMLDLYSAARLFTALNTIEALIQHELWDEAVKWSLDFASQGPGRVFDSVNVSALQEFRSTAIRLDAAVQARQKDNALKHIREARRLLEIVTGKTPRA